MKTIDPLSSFLYTSTRVGTRDRELQTRLFVLIHLRAKTKVNHRAGQKMVQTLIFRNFKSFPPTETDNIA